MQTSTFVSQRKSSGNNSLDTQFITENFETVLSHLKARRSSQSLIEDISKIPKLRSLRNSLIIDRDAALNSRKTLSNEIGSLLKSGKVDEANKLKQKVEDIKVSADESSYKLEKVDEEINSIFRLMPNLLDDR
jgi:seryl-tRNA synthetase